jgi:hypothetical protein
MYVPVDFKYTVAPSAPTTFVVSKVLGNLRNGFGGWVGMRLTVGANALTVTELARIFVSGNNGVHTVKFVRASDQTDVPNGSISLAMSGGTAGQFKYGTLSSPVTLAANTIYYLVSEEFAGGDQWYDQSTTTVATTGAGTCDGGVFSGSGFPWTLLANPNHTFGPVDFKYTSGGSPPPPLAATGPFSRKDGLTAEVSLSSNFKNGAIEVTLKGEPGQTFLIESSADLQVWSPLDTVTLTGSTATLTDYITVDQPCKFYRAVSKR